MYSFFFVILGFMLVFVMIAVGHVGANPSTIRPLISAPGDYFWLLISRRRRRHHAIEHATINLLDIRYRGSRVTGYPTASGFTLRGPGLNADVVASHVTDAVRRLRNGDRKLAIQRRCPTSLVAAQLTLALIGLAVVIAIDWFNPASLLAVLIAASLPGPWLSIWFQRLLLSTPNIGNLRLSDATLEQPSGKLAVVTMLAYQTVHVDLMETGSSRGGGGDMTLITRDRKEIPIGNYRVRE